MTRSHHEVNPTDSATNVEARSGRSYRGIGNSKLRRRWLNELGSSTFLNPSREITGQCSEKPAERPFAWARGGVGNHNNQRANDEPFDKHQPRLIQPAGRHPECRLVRKPEGRFSHRKEGYRDSGRGAGTSGRAGEADASGVFLLPPVGRTPRRGRQAALRGEDRAAPHACCCRRARMVRRIGRQDPVSVHHGRCGSANAGADRNHPGWPLSADRPNDNRSGRPG